MRVVLLVTVLRKKGRREGTHGNSASLSESKVNLQACTEEQHSAVPHNRTFCDRELCHYTLFTNRFCFVDDKWNPHLFHLRAHTSSSFGNSCLSLLSGCYSPWHIQPVLNAKYTALFKEEGTLRAWFGFEILKFWDRFIIHRLFFNTSSFFCCNVSWNLSRECFI